MNKSELSLYLVTDRGNLSDQDFLTKIEQAILGGVTCVQLREKELSSRAFYELAIQVKAVTDRYHIPFLINDRLDIALAVNASGVHLGQSDLPVAVARHLLGSDKLIGISAKTVASISCTSRRSRLFGCWRYVSNYNESHHARDNTRNFDGDY